MKGYLKGYEYMGYLPSIGEYRRFETEDEYVEYYRKYEKDEGEDEEGS